MSFEHFFPALVGLIITVLFFKKIKKYQNYIGFSSTKLLDIDIPFKTKLFHKIPKILIYLIIFGIFLALSNPIIKRGKFFESAVSRDIAILVDMSYSMELEGKIKIAKEILTDFIKERKNDRIALLIFGDKTIKVWPYSKSYVTLKKMFSSLGNEINYLCGTQTWEALRDSLDFIIRNSNSKNPILIIVSDGEDSTLNQPRIEFLAHVIKTNNIKVYWIQIKGINVIDEISSSIYLIKLFDEMKAGKYFLSKDKDRFKKIISEISKIEKTKYKLEKFNSNYKLYPIICMITGILFGTLVVVKSFEI